MHTCPEDLPFKSNPFQLSLNLEAQWIYLHLYFSLGFDSNNGYGLQSVNSIFAPVFKKKIDQKNLLLQNLLYFIILNFNKIYSYLYIFYNMYMNNNTIKLLVFIICKIYNIADNFKYLINQLLKLFICVYFKKNLSLN